jgi:trimethylamine--corrinoid protein Co-methyltransferase
MSDTALAPSPSSRRSGGRKARHAHRAAAPALDARPIWPGMIGGTFAPLTPADQTKIHNAALRVLEEIGLCDAPPSGVALMTGAGAKLGEDGRLRFSAKVIEEALALTTRGLNLLRATWRMTLICRAHAFITAPPVRLCTLLTA